MTKKIMIGSLILVFALLLISPTTSKAYTLTFEYSYVFDGDTPAGTAPWLTAEFSDDSTSGTVTLTLQTHFGMTGQKVGEWDFNVNPFTSLTIVPHKSNLITAKSIEVKENAFKGGGDGYFDIEFLFDPANSKAFKGDMTVVYTITGPGITVDSFDFFSSPTKRTGGDEVTDIRSIAHVQGIPIEIINGKKEGSAWIADLAPVPEPATVFLLGSGLIGVGVFVRRKFRK